MSEYISIQRNGNVALVYINNPPVNAGSLAVRRGILEAIELVDPDWCRPYRCGKNVYCRL